MLALILVLGLGVLLGLFVTTNLYRIFLDPNYIEFAGMIQLHTSKECAHKYYWKSAEPPCYETARTISDYYKNNPPLLSKVLETMVNYPNYKSWILKYLSEDASKYSFWSCEEKDTHQEILDLTQVNIKHPPEYVCYPKTN